HALHDFSLLVAWRQRDDQVAQFTAVYVMHSTSRSCGKFYLTSHHGCSKSVIQVSRNSHILIWTHPNKISRIGEAAKLPGHQSCLSYQRNATVRSDNQ